MHKPKLNLTLTTRVLLIISIWLLAVLMSACSTNIQFATQVEKSRQVVVQHVQKPAAIHHDRKKQQFFAIMKPIVVSENNRILKLREHIKQLGTMPNLNPQQQAWLQHLAGEYGVKMTALQSYEALQQLLTRVDIIPLEIALVQAANESAWGQSRFAKQGNNYFGQWCYQKGCGLVPKQRAAGPSMKLGALIM